MEDIFFADDFILIVVIQRGIQNFKWGYYISSMQRMFT